MSRIPVTVLGATGVVGQRFVARLARHPFFELAALAASERNVGKRYREACAWRASGEAWAGYGDRVLVDASSASAFAPIVFSALDAEAASRIEPEFARAGALVFSNASAFRMEADVPLLVPEINRPHLALLDAQRGARQWRGGLVCNPNCTTAVLALVLAPLERAFGLEALSMTSLQAVSGAGYPGAPSLDVMGNVLPFIRGEEAKVEEEARKILGGLAPATSGGPDTAEARVDPADFAISATCTRVPVRDGHTISASLRLRGHPAPQDVAEVLRAWKPDIEALCLPSAPARPIQVSEDETRPQPLLDVEAGGGLAVTVGRIRACPVLGVKLVILGHNLERGAAGASVLNAELACAEGLVG